MSERPINIAVVGVGKIVRDQHLPAITDNDAFKLVAAVSRNATVDGVDCYTSIEQMFSARQDIAAVALCMPPQYRYQVAREAILNGAHVLLEKPPGATVSGVDQLQKLARARNVTLFATWHARFAAAVETAKAMLIEARLQSVELRWREDVKKWHPGQQWIWQAGGLGVFDPGINGISILTEIVSEPVFVTRSELSFPRNKAAPIAARLQMSTASGIPITLDLDWRADDAEDWSIECRTEQGLLKLEAGGAKLSLDGNEIPVPAANEYTGIYDRFAQLIDHSESEVDLTPLQLCADAFLIASNQQVAAFDD